MPTEDVDLSGEWGPGHLIRTGQGVVLFLEAANRDPARFPRPPSAQRQPSPHLAFGHGAHRCPRSRTFQARGGKAHFVSGCVFRRRMISFFPDEQGRLPCPVERFAPGRVERCSPGRVRFAPEGDVSWQDQGSCGAHGPRSFTSQARFFEGKQAMDASSTSLSVKVSAVRAELPAIEPAGRGGGLPLPFAQQRLWLLE